MDGRRISWILLTAVTTLGGLSALYVASTQAGDQTPLVARTWEQFASQDPEVASITARLLVVLGLLGAGFASLGVIISVIPYRHGQRWAWYALWVVPVIYGGIAARQLADQYPIAYLYAALAAMATVGLLIPIRRLQAWS